MKYLAYLVFTTCLQITLPNPYTINNLTSEQQGVLRKYAEAKCNREASFYRSIQEDNQCNEVTGEQPPECM